MLYKSKVEDFCPVCGSKVFAKDDKQAERCEDSRNIVLYCSICDTDLAYKEVFSLKTDYNQLNGQEHMKYLIFPFGYCDLNIKGGKQ